MIIFRLILFIAFISLGTCRRGKKSSSICTPSTKKYFSKFIIQRWKDALLELNLKLPYESELTSEYTKFLQNLNDIYSFHAGVLVHRVFNSSNSLIPYARIYKCGNEAIGSNLDQISGNLDQQNRFDNIRSQSQLESIIVSMKRDVKTDDDLFTPVFTFVRDPMEKFISGFVELVFRSYNELPFGVPGSNKKLTPEVTTDAFNKFFGFKEQKLDFYFVNHMYPISGILFDFDIHVIGELKNLEHEWNTKIKPLYNITGFEFNNRAGIHPTSVSHPLARHSREGLDDMDPNKARKVTHDVLKNDVKYLRAICNFLLIDYVCLPYYSLPKECQYLNKTVDLARAYAKRREVIPAIMHHHH